MKKRKIYRDGLEEEIIDAIKTHVTKEGHVVESYKTSTGKKRYFATISGTHWCAHGDSIAEAISDALWKDPANRPDREKLKTEIIKAGKIRKITLSEFKHLTGACSSGCQVALERAKRDASPLTAHEIRDFISKEWGNKLLEILEWK